MVGQWVGQFARLQQLRRAALREPFLRRLARVNPRHVGILPAEHRHEFVLARARLGRPDRAGFAKAVGRASRKACFPAPILERIPKARIRIGSAISRLQPGLMPKRARIQNGTKARKNW
jgi:hypothetical protein